MKIFLLPTRNFVWLLKPNGNFPSINTERFVSAQNFAQFPIYVKQESTLFAIPVHQETIIK